MNKINLLLVCSVLCVSSCAARPGMDKISKDDYNGYYKVGEPYKIDDKWYYPKEQPDYDAVGVSSWYGDEFHGKQTANGDTFDKNSLTAAHNTLPLPSMVRVTNLENNKTLILMVNDRGPFAKGRVIDVSERAAEILGYKNKGIAKVRVQFLQGQTNRLLASLDKPPVKEDKKFSFFRTNEPSPFDPDYGDKRPVDLLPETGSILDPVKKLSKLFKPNAENTESPLAPTKVGDLPEINIESQQASVAEKVAEAPVTPMDKASDYSKPTPYVETTQPAVEAKPVENELAAAADKLEESVDFSEISEWQDESGQQVAIDNSEPIEGMVEDAKIAKKQQEVIAEMEAAKIVSQMPQVYVQAGTYGVKANAARVEAALAALGEVVITPVERGRRTLYRVRLGPLPNDDIAKIALEKVVKLGHPDAMLVKDVASLQ